MYRSREMKIQHKPLLEQHTVRALSLKIKSNEVTLWVYKSLKSRLPFKAGLRCTMLHWLALQASKKWSCANVFTMTQLQISYILNSVFFKQTSFFWYTISSQWQCWPQSWCLGWPGYRREDSTEIPLSAILFCLSPVCPVFHWACCSPLP